MKKHIDPRRNDSKDKSPATMKPLSLDQLASVGGGGGINRIVVTDGTINP